MCNVAAASQNVDLVLIFYHESYLQRSDQSYRLETLSPCPTPFLRRDQGNDSKSLCRGELLGVNCCESLTHKNLLDSIPGGDR